MGKKIFLHLEDSRISQKLLQANFVDYADVFGAHTVRDAEEQLATLPDIDCFIVDYNIAEGKSLLFIKNIRTIEKYITVPVILWTATLTNDIAYKSMEAGVNESVSKLQPMPELKEIVIGQINRPHVKTIVRDIYEMSCVAWEMDRMHFQYCPHINERICAPTPEAASKKMKELLQSTVNTDKKKIHEVTMTRVYMHVIRVEK